MRYSNQELSLMRNTFLNNDSLLKTIRKVMWQAPLNKVDKSFIDELQKNKAVMAVIRKTFLPELDVEAPTSQVVDLWMTIDIKEKSPDEALPYICSRELLIKYLDQQLKFIEIGKEDFEILFENLLRMEKKSSFEIYVNLLTRNMILGHTEQQLNQFVVLANQAVESPMQKEAKDKKDSGK